MTCNIEIEMRYKLNSEDLTPLLRKFTYLGQRRVIDEYFDTPGSKYYKDGIFIRIRNHRCLDIKFNPEHLTETDSVAKREHISCHEYSFHQNRIAEERESFESLEELTGLRQPTENTFESFLDNNQLGPLLMVDKIRKTYKSGAYTLVIDDIQGLGKFLEIEYSGPQTEDKNIEEILEDIDVMVKNIPVTPMATGAFELLLRQQDFSLYRQGKYLLEEDMVPKAA